MIDDLDQIRFEPRSGQTKKYTIGMYCLSAKQAVSRNKSSKDWLVMYSTQDEEKQNIHKTQYMFDRTMCKETQLTLVRHESSYKQMEAKTSRTLFCMQKS